LLFVLLFSNAANVAAQEAVNRNWEGQKIKGVRYVAYPTYNGFPFLTDTWVPGKIEFTNGESIDSLFLRYSSFKDELLYYNKALSIQIVIDKASINGFSFTALDGNTRLFRKQYYNGYMKGDHFFEVLSVGETDLLVWRRMILTNVLQYKDESKIMKDQAYISANQFYFYSPEKGYTMVRLNRNALLEKFSAVDQKPVKKVLRKNRIRISDEQSLILAWKTIEREGYRIVF
jgi:hypothetical protein